MVEAVNPFPNDPVNADILPSAGSDLLYRQAAGFERALADVDAQRITAIYAELVRDQWDADKISYRNLAYLAWAMGVNLWEKDWDETFQRWWVKNQWQLKEQRGSLWGTKRFVKAVKYEVKRAIVPPAITYPLRADTEEERAAYVARFPQLRLYPYVAREMLAWLCYVNAPHHMALSTDLGDPVEGDLVYSETEIEDEYYRELGRNGDLIEYWHWHTTDAEREWEELEGTRDYSKNGAFLGPLRGLYPTIQNQGGNYTRTAKYWDRGVETNLTVRRVIRVQMPTTTAYTPGVYAYDEQVTIPFEQIFYYMEQDGLARPQKYPGGGGKHGVFTGRKTGIHTITISRSDQFWLPSNITIGQGKAQYQTVSPDVDLLRLEPEMVTTKHSIRSTELYAARKQYLYGKFLPRSNAWQYIYERWYVFDADRVPDYRRKGVYLDHTRLGIDRYTAEMMIRIRTKRPRFMAQDTGWVYGFLRARDDEPIRRTRRAVTASMALRDTVLIDTRTVRPLQVGDIIDATGRVAVGELVPA